MEFVVLGSPSECCLQKMVVFQESRRRLAQPCQRKDGEFLEKECAAFGLVLPMGTSLICEPQGAIEGFRARE